MAFTVSTVRTEALTNRFVTKQEALGRSLEKVTTGERLNRAADDAAALSMAERFGGRARALAQASKNAQDGLSMLQTAEGGLRNIQDMLRRLRTLAVQAASDSLTSADRAPIQVEVKQLLAEIDRESSVVQFNGKKLLGPVSDTPDPTDIVFVVDTSFTMTPFIDNVIAGLSSLTQGLANAGISARYALLDVNDTRYLFPDNGIDLRQDFTDETTIAGALAALKPVTGAVVRNWDAVIAALPGGADAPSWRPQPPTQRFLIQVTDTTGDESPNTVATEADAAAAMVAAGARYYGVVQPFLASDYDDIAAATGGQLFDINDPDYNPLLGAIRDDILATVAEIRLQGPWVFHVGPDKDQTVVLRFPVDARAEALGVGSADVSTREGAEGAIEAADGALELVSGYLAVLGAQANRLEHTIQSVETMRQEALRAEQRIRETDYGTELGRFVMLQVQAQATSAAITQSNLETQTVLTLLR